MPSIKNLIFKAKKVSTVNITSDYKMITKQFLEIVVETVENGSYQIWVVNTDIRSYNLAREIC